ncbi:hypothetical protein Q7P35_001525 [Cladosporium inversicolor]
MPTEHHTEAPINSTDAMFDGIVTQERKIGLMIDLGSFEDPRIKPIVGSTILHGSDEYSTAMERRLSRILNNHPGKERLHWESGSLAMGLRTTETGTKNVRYVEMSVPITGDQTCDCGCGEPDYECLTCRKTLSVLYVFDLEPTALAQQSSYRSEERRGRVILNHELSSEDAFACLRAHWKTMQTDWTWRSQNDLDLGALWLRILAALILIVFETIQFHQERRRLRARAARLARRLARRLVLLPALTDRELLDRVLSWRSCIPLSSPPADDAVVAAEAMEAFDSPSYPCINGYYPGSCDVCDDEC